MGQLPLDRTAPQRPFLVTGVDYAGPIMLRTSPGRGHKSYKGYISLFVCLTTRAIHLEVVSDLTSASFLVAIQRFVGRRGRCASMYSGNATVFHGAERELTRMFTSASVFYKETAAVLAKDGTTWHFIPPYAPHFGGLWEVGVKSVKHHLRRVIGNSTLTFEKMSTLLCQIEACLYSRPLYALSEDPSDLSALTPGHFLIGESTSNSPEPNPPLTTSSSLTRWRQINTMPSQFWNRWRSEYLQHLQQLSKWRHQKENLKVGALVLLRDNLQPPAKWLMGRVTALHPGPDGRVRVVALKTASGTTTRPIVLPSAGGPDRRPLTT
nr:uncharacterized protein LOC117611324 [Osmia lignaria]